jgi:putative ABC transport system ATP-binding protein
MIEVCDVTKTFNRGKSNEFTAVRGVNLVLAAGRIAVISGPSGSGKTTLLTVLGCMARPTSGRVQVFGHDVAGLPERFLAAVRRTTFGFIFQSFNLIPGLTVLDNVMIPAYPLGGSYSALKRRAHEILDRVRLETKARQCVETLSGGEQQRVAIARALINDPQVIVADEPTAHLDSELSTEVLATLAGLKDSGKTIIMTSHDPLVRDAPCVEHWVEMRDGVVTRETRR